MFGGLFDLNCDGIMSPEEETLAFLSLKELLAKPDPKPGEDSENDENDGDSDAV